MQLSKRIKAASFQSPLTTFGHETWWAYSTNPERHTVHKLLVLQWLLLSMHHTLINFGHFSKLRSLSKKEREQKVITSEVHYAVWRNKTHTRSC